MFRLKKKHWSPSQARTQLEEQANTYELELRSLGMSQSKALASAAANSHAEGQIEALASERDGLAAALHELQETLKRDAAAAAAREDELRNEIADVTARCHAAEERFVSGEATIAEATRHLVRQVEAQQQAALQQEAAWLVSGRLLQVRTTQKHAKHRVSLLLNNSI